MLKPSLLPAYDASNHPLDFAPKSTVGKVGTGGISRNLAKTWHRPVWPFSAGAIRFPSESALAFEGVKRDALAVVATVALPIRVETLNNQLHFVS